MSSSIRLESQKYNGRYMYLSCTQEQDIAKNQSKINWTLTVTGGSSNYYSTGPTTVKINDEVVYYCEEVVWTKKVFPAAKGSISSESEVYSPVYVPHKDDGTQKITISICTDIATDVPETKSAEWELDKITRQALIKKESVSDWNDEENPAFEFTPAGAGTVDVWLELNQTDTHLCERNEIVNTGTYTWDLTEDERNELRAACTGNSCPVRIVLCTNINEEQYEDYVDRTFSIINAIPTLNPTVVDANEKTIGLTGDADVLVRYFSDAAISFGANALKGATIEKTTVTNGSQYLKEDGTIRGVESGAFLFTVTDSRGNIATKTIEKQVIDYTKTSCVIGSNVPNADGDYTFSVSGNFFNGSFGAEAVSLDVRFRYKEVGGNWIGVDNDGWHAMTITDRDGNSYSAEVNIQKLDYRKTYIFQAKAADQLTSYLTNNKTVKTMPVFDWSEKDFNFNVPVSAPSMNGVYLGIAKTNGSNSFTVKIAFNEDEGNQQSLLIFGNSNDLLVSGIVGVNNAWQTSWSGTDGVTVSAGSDGQITIQVPNESQDIFTLISAKPFEIIQ